MKSISQPKETHPLNYTVSPQNVTEGSPPINSIKRNQKIDKKKINCTDYKYHIHPIIKLLFFGILNFVAFLSNFEQFSFIFLGIEFILAIFIKLDIHRIQGFFKFLFMNFIGIYILFYFVDYNWLNALILFYHYAISMLILFLGAFIFVQSTPPRELLIAFRIMRIPRKFALAITVAIAFLPLLTEQIRLTLAYQESRGYEFHFWNLSPIIIPSLLNILNLSMNLGISMESRGYEL